MLILYIVSMISCALINPFAKFSVQRQKKFTRLFIRSLDAFFPNAPLCPSLTCHPIILIGWIRNKRQVWNNRVKNFYSTIPYIVVSYLVVLVITDNGYSTVYEFRMNLSIDKSRNIAINIRKNSFERVVSLLDSRENLRKPRLYAFYFEQ